MTDMPIGADYPRAGWNSAGHASAMFCRYLGVTTFEYRRYEPPSASYDHRPGTGLEQAAKSTKEPVGRGIVMELSTGHMPQIIETMRQSALLRFTTRGVWSVQLPRRYRVFAHTVPR